MNPHPPRNPSRTSPSATHHPPHHATPPHTERTEKEPPIPAQHPTPPATRHPPQPHTPRMGTGTQYKHHGEKEGRGGGYMMRSPQGGLNTGVDKQKVVVCLRQGKDPASRHPGAQEPLGWDDRLDAPGQWRGKLPSSVWTRHKAVKQGKSRGSVGTTGQGKGKGSREGKIGQGRRGRA